jgi:predicted enzyme related to lactoylglutathione lyase
MANINAVVWFDIFVEDLERATVFYETVLGQTLAEMSDPTGETEMMAFSAEMTNYGAAGALTKAPHGKPGVGGTTIYFGSADTAIEEARIVSAGGQIIRSKFSIGEFGFVTLAMDTEGNIFGLNSLK